jgi:hypothetical protein
MGLFRAAEIDIMMIECLLRNGDEHGGHATSPKNNANIALQLKYKRTLSSLIKSAVSSNVNLPISDTIPSIFGFVTAAASVDCHLLDALRRSVEVH